MVVNVIVNNSLFNPGIIENLFLVAKFQDYNTIDDWKTLATPFVFIVVHFL